MNRVRQPFNVSVVAQAAAGAALTTTNLCAGARISTAWVCARSSTAGSARPRPYPVVRKFHQLPREPCGANLSAAKQGVIVRPIGVYGLPEHLRVTIGLPEENERFLDALRMALHA
jgi:histidinol-phosphate aminotransferase